MEVSTAPTWRLEDGAKLAQVPKAISIELRRVARKARVTKPNSTGGGGFRARAADKIYRRVLVGSFGALFIIPTGLVAIYLIFFAADQFVTESRFVVKSGESSALEGLAGLSNIVDTGISKDGLIIADFIESRAMIEALSRKFDLTRIYRPGNHDFVGQLQTDASIEDLAEHWKTIVDVSVNRSSGLVDLRVRAFTPQDSWNLSQEILAISEGMVNRLSNRDEEDTLELAQLELDRSKKALENAVTDLRDARDAAGVLDIDATAKVYGEIVGKLRLQLASNQQEIDTLTSTNAENAPQLGALRAKGKALSAQISQYEKLISGETTDGSAVNLVQRDQLLSQKGLELKIAQANYTSAAATYKAAYITTERQKFYIQTYVTPTLPESSTYPNRPLVGFGTLIGSFLLWCTFAGLSNLIYNNTAS